jgi:perosamine synthetase
MTWPPTSDRSIRDAVIAVLDRGVLVGGPEVPALEDEFAQATGLSNIVAVSSGTAALTASLIISGVRPGDKVIVPALTFSGTVLPIIHIGAIPVFIDVDAETYCLDPGHAAGLALQIGARAVILVHLHGYPLRVPSDIRTALQQAGVRLIEDCCQAAGSHLPDASKQPLGGQGIASAYSLNERKQVFAGEGGLVATESAELAELVRRLRRYGEPSEQQDARWRSYESLQIGYNWKLSEIPAAIARNSVKELEARTLLANENAGILTAAAAQTQLIPPTAGDGRHSWHKYRVKCPAGRRDEIMKQLTSRAVPVSRWQTRILPEMAAFRTWAGAYGQTYRNSLAAIEDTFVIGDETHPLYGSGSSEVEAWAEGMLAVRS